MAPPLCQVFYARLVILFRLYCSSIVLMIQIFNTLTGIKEPLKKTSRPIRLFVCGPTVYDSPHIGNARTYVAFDIIVRSLRTLGYTIVYLQNITDIDDKIIQRAQQTKTSWRTLARSYEREYHQNEYDLGIISVDVYARATDHIPHIVAQVQALLKKGYAYAIADDGYYFDIARFKDYGKLSGRTALQAEDAVTRVDDSVAKRNKGDFALWKFAKPGEPSWKTALGSGRPGWHIEDTAITETYFGTQYDIHGGALDLKFPHHEAEIAQQEAASGKSPLVRLWMHTGFLLMQGEKMSKSKGNFLSINDFLTSYPAPVFRYIVLSHHYRAPLDYTNTTASQAHAALASIQLFVWKLHTITQKGMLSKTIKDIVALARNHYHQAIEDDFNTPLALAALFELIGTTEKILETLSARDATYIASYITDTFRTLGISLSARPTIPAAITRLNTQREAHRRYKQFMQADALRNEMDTLGYIVEDTPHGPFLYPKSH